MQDRIEIHNKEIKAKAGRNIAAMLADNGLTPETFAEMQSNTYWKRDNIARNIRDLINGEGHLYMDTLNYVRNAIRNGNGVFWS